MFKFHSWDNRQYQLYIILGRNSATHPTQGPEQKSWKPKVASNVTSIHIIHSILWYHPRDKGVAAKMQGREYQLCRPVCRPMLVDYWPVDDCTNLDSTPTWITLVPTVELSPFVWDRQILGQCPAACSITTNCGWPGTDGSWRRVFWRSDAKLQMVTSLT